MELTSLGQYLFPRAKELLSNDKRLDDEVKGIAQGKRGWIRYRFHAVGEYRALAGQHSAVQEIVP